MSRRTVATFVALVVLVQVNKRVVSAEDVRREEILRRVLPAYGLAATSSSALNANDHTECRSELKLFRRAVDDKRLWAIKSAYVQARR